jgi:hypothetical protein
VGVAMAGGAAQSTAASPFSYKLVGSNATPLHAPGTLQWGRASIPRARAFLLFFLRRAKLRGALSCANKRACLYVPWAIY